MNHNLYITRRIMNEVPYVIQAKLWSMTLRRTEVSIADYLHVFNIKIQSGNAIITHSQEIPSYKCTAEVTCNSRQMTNYKIYVMADHVTGEHSVYTMYFAEEY